MNVGSNSGSPPGRAGTTSAIPADIDSSIEKCCFRSCKQVAGDMKHPCLLKDYGVLNVSPKPSFRDAYTFANSETGAGILETGDGEASFHDIVLHKCPYYDDNIVDIMTDRESSAPKAPHYDLDMDHTDKNALPYGIFKRKKADIIKETNLAPLNILDTASSMTHDCQAIGLLCHQYPIPYQQHHGKIANGQKGLLAKQNVGWFWRRSEAKSIHQSIQLCFFMDHYSPSVLSMMMMFLWFLCR